jgi:hypothetical protein
LLEADHFENLPSSLLRYDLAVWPTGPLTENEEIAFTARIATEWIRTGCEDFERLFVMPWVVDVSAA